MAEDKKTLTLWDFYDTDRRFEGGLVIDDRSGAGIYDHLKYLDEEGRKRFISRLPSRFRRRVRPLASPTCRNSS